MFNRSFLAVLLLVTSNLLVAQQSKEDPPPVPGQMVDIGGYRLHLYCIGKGSPTVIFENGAGDIFTDWSLVQPDVGQFTRTCSYDHAYEGFSDAGPVPATMHQEVFKIAPPYIFVGHSSGGMLARLYTITYPKEVAGLVLVDSLHEDTPMGDKMFRERATGKPIPTPQTMKTSPPLPPTPEEQAHFEQRKKQLEAEAAAPVGPPLNRLPREMLRLRAWAHAHPKFLTPKGDPMIWVPDELQQLHDWRQGKLHPFGGIPIIVIGTFRDNPVSQEERQRQLEDMASLSNNSKVVINPNSGHHVQWDDPNFVIQAIREDYDAVKQDLALKK
ncbi:MAG TPA: alpha/beta hydrolase [Candidatus Nanopelagicaceae bacterium]|jgi:pimeloyl-ACP methyl ester carboxylesterase